MTASRYAGYPGGCCCSPLGTRKRSDGIVPEPREDGRDGRDPAKRDAVSRAYYKLADFTKAIGFSFTDKTVLDIGSSTGGFTEFALSHGAKKVIAVEKGTNQMKAPLRRDPRIELHEKTNIFDFKCKADVILADVSFISLTKVLKYAKIHLSRSDTQFLVMMKPQFEARPDQLNKGVVKNEKYRRQIIKGFEIWLKNNGFFIVKKRDNDLAGKNGNLERFYLLKKI